MSRWIVALFLSLVLPWAASAPPHDGVACVAADAAADEASIEAHVDTDASTDPDLFDAAPQASAATQATPSCGGADAADAAQGSTSERKSATIQRDMADRV
jgi:hypothetical protein